MKFVNHRFIKSNVTEKASIDDMSVGHKNQHYVPQYYFRSFSQDARSICLLQRDTGAQVKSAPIKGQASRNNFYGNSEIEHTLSKLEGIYSGVFRELLDIESLSDLGEDSLLELYQSILFQRSRTLAARDRSAPTMDRLWQRYWMGLVIDDDNLDDATKAAFLQIARNLTSDRQDDQLVEMKGYIERARILGIHQAVLVENHTSTPFIFGDAPVVFVNPYLNNIKRHGVLGVARPGIVVIYPISPRKTIFIYDHRIYSINKQSVDPLFITSNSDIDIFNKLQIHNSRSCVYYSSEKLDKYVKRIWQEEKYRLSSQISITEELSIYDDNGIPHGIGVHGFEPQIPLCPKFKFLQFNQYRGDEFLKLYEV